MKILSVLVVLLFAGCSNHCHDRPWIVTNVENLPLTKSSNITINHYWYPVSTKYMQYQVGDTVK